MERGKGATWLDFFLNVVFLVVFIGVVYYLYTSSQAIRNILDITVLKSQALDAIPKIFLVIFLYFIFRIIFILFHSIFLLRLKGTVFDESRFKSVTALVRFTWWAVFAIIVITLLISNAASLVASAGLIGLGLTFALQKPITNFVGWLTIIIKDVYNEGDRIKVGNVVGDVKEIQLMNTVIYSLVEGANVRSHKITMIPNELVLTTEVENFTKDSNYIKEELRISITYESDYKKAMKILKDIVKTEIRDNIKHYIKKKTTEKERLDKLVKGLVRRGDMKKIRDENLNAEQDHLNEEIEQLKQLDGGELNPRIRLEMADSSIVLVAQFLTPYYDVTKSNSEINEAFLDATRKEKNIEIAYPHLELINKDKKRKLKF